MTHVSWVNRSIFLATNTGTASFGIGAAVTGYMTPSSAGAIDGEQYHYAAETTNGSGTVSAWEIGTGVYTATASTLARTALFSSSTNNKVNFATAPYVMLTAFADDFDLELDADTTFYVATTGSDSTGTGKIGAPWATLQFAYDTVSSYELNAFTVTIQIADGTYAGCRCLKNTATGNIVFSGNAVTPANVIINENSLGSTCFTFTSRGLIRIENLTITKAASGTVGVGAVTDQSALSLFLSNVSFSGGFTLACISLQDGPFLDISGTWSITGNSQYALRIEGVAQLQLSGDLTLVGTPAFSGAFAYVYDQSLLHSFVGSTPTFTGSATGKRFIVSDGGVIQTTTNNLSFFPGDAAGDILQGGQYDIYGVREILITDRTYYVATTGSDTTGDGSAGNPWATIQHSYDFITSRLDTAGFTVTVQVADGTYTSGLSIAKAWTGGGILVYRGNPTTPANVFINVSSGACFDIQAPLPAALKVGGFKTAGGDYGFNHNAAGLVWIYDNMEFGANAVYQLSAGAPGSNLFIDAIDYTISGGAGCHLIAHFFGFLTLAANAVTITGTPNFSQAFFVAEVLGLGSFGGTTFSGSATGFKFGVAENSLLSGGGHIDYLPGDLPGRAFFGGIYAYDDGVLFGAQTTIPSGGFNVIPGDGGTVSSGTFTPDARLNGNYQYYTNNGAHAFAVPAADCALDVLVTNGASAGAISFSGSYTVGTTGDALTTTSGNKFIISVRRINSISTYLIKALQ